MFILIFLATILGFIIPMSLYMGGYYILLWIPLGIFLGYLQFLLALIASVYIWEKASIFNRFKNYVYRSACYGMNKLLFNVKVTVTGQENMPKTGGVVVYANHKSYVDAIILLPNIKRPSAFTPKDSLFKIPFFKRLMLSIGCMPVYRGNDRATAKALINAIKNVSNGFVMTVFPEGGRKNRDTDEVLQTRAGAFKLAVKSKATIVPMSINNSALIGKRAPFRRTKVSLVIGKPILFDDYNHLNTNEIADLVQEKINEGMI